MADPAPNQTESWTVKRARVAGLTRRNASPETIEAARADLAAARAVRAVDDPAELARGETVDSFIVK